MVLQGMLDKLIEYGRYYGLEINVEKTKVMRISRQPSPITITIDITIDVLYPQKKK